MSTECRTKRMVGRRYRCPVFFDDGNGCKRGLRMEDNNELKQRPEGFVVGGYTYETEESARQAKEEMEAVRYLSSKADYSDIGQVYRLYNSILDKQLFKTQVGMDYLKKLQQHLYKNKAVPNEKIRPIPINVDLQQALDDRREALQQKGLVSRLKKQLSEYKGYLVKSVIVNIVLIIVVIAMIIITATSKNPTVLNYETKLQDKYSSWEEDLKSREAVIKQKENELGIR